MVRFNVEDSFAVPQSSVIYAIVLAANIEETVTVPDYAKYVIFTSTANFWMKVNDDGVITVPVADDITGDAPELNPVNRAVVAGDILHLIAPLTSTISIAFYS